MLPAKNSSIGGINADHFVMEEPRFSEPCQWPKINIGLFERIVASNQARQHSRVRSVSIAGDKSEPHPRHRIHTEFFQNGDVAVATTNKH